MKRKHILSWVGTAFFCVLCFIWVLPIIIVLMDSFKSRTFISLQPFELPTEQTFVGLENYIQAIDRYGFLDAVWWTVFITIGSVFVILLCCSMCAWFITRVSNRFNRAVYLLCVLSMVVPFQMVMFTLSLVADRLNLDTPWGIIIIYLGFGAGLAVFMFCGFVKSIPIEIEEAALKNEDDELSKARLAELQKELAEQRETFNAMKAKWENEKNAIGRVQQLREKIEQLNRDIEAAEQSYDLEKAAKLKYGDLPEAKKQLEQEEKLAQNGKETSLLRNKVTEEEIAKIIERWTGIPTARLMEGERDKLLHLEDTLHKRVVGQDEAVRVVSEAIQRSRAGIQDPNRPLGSFLFLGPTGVGKTELAKTLAEALFDDEKNLIRIDMTEYMEKFSVSRLIGAPPGYVGYEEGGQLTEAVRRRPYSVILFDEIEKAHPDVFNILLQVLDDGRITDSQGRTVDFKNTIIILTSNLGSQAILDGITPAGEISEEAKNEVQTLLRRSFRPEFLNRLDEIVFYKPLSKENITGIIDLQIAALNKRLADKQLTCELTPAAKTFVIDAAYDPQFGARPLRRYLQHTVETLLAQRILRGDVLPGQTLVCDAQNGELVITAK